MGGRELTWRSMSTRPDPSASTPVPTAQAPAPSVDAHQHYWQIARGDYDWMAAPSVAALRRDYLPADLRPELARHGIAHTVAVQAAPTTAETDFLLALAAAEPSLIGVVGWLDLEAHDFEQQLAQRRQHPKFLGIRPMLQDLADDLYVLRPRVLQSLGELSRADARLDLLILPRHLPHATRAMGAVPELRAIVDHCGKPDLASEELTAWRAGIRALSQNPNVYCKLSGLVTEAKPSCTASDLAPAVEHVIECFGLERLVFGSDWPVCTLAASYARVLELTREVLGGALSPRTERALFRDNAARFYGLTTLEPSASAAVEA